MKENEWFHFSIKPGEPSYYQIRASEKKSPMRVFIEDPEDPTAKPIIQTYASPVFKMPTRTTNSFCFKVS